MLLSPGRLSIKGTLAGDDMFMDDEGRYIIFRNIKGKTVPIRSNAEEFLNYLAEKGVPVDPANQQLLWAADDALATASSLLDPNVDGSLNPGAIGQSQEYLDEWVESLTEDQQQNWQEYQSKRENLKNIVREMLSKRKDHKPEKEEEYKRILAETPPKEHEEYKGWDTLLESYTDPEGEADVDEPRWGALKGFDLLMMRVLDMVKSGEDMSKFSLEDMLEMELGDHASWHKHYKDRYAQYFGSRSEGNVILYDGLQTLKYNLDSNTEAGQVLNKVFDNWRDNMQRDFRPQEKSHTRVDIGKPKTPTLGRELPKHLPARYSRDEGERLSNYIHEKDTGASHETKISDVSKHLVSRLVQMAGTWDSNTIKQQFTNTGEDEYKSLNSQHKEGWNQVWDAVTKGRELGADSLAEQMITIANGVLRDETPSTAKLTGALREIAFIQGQIDGLNHYNQYRTTYGSGRRGKRGEFSSALNSATGTNMDEALEDSINGKSHSLPNSTLRIWHDEVGDYSPTPPPMSLAGNATDNIENNFGFDDEWEHKNGYRVAASDIDEFVGEDEHLRSRIHNAETGDSDRVLVLLDDNGEFVSGYRMSKDTSEGEAFAELWQDMDGVKNIYASAPAENPNIVDRITSAFSFSDDAQYDALTSEGKKQFNDIRTTLSQYSQTNIAQLDGADGDVFHLILPDGKLEISAHNGEINAEWKEEGVKGTRLYGGEAAVGAIRSLMHSSWGAPDQEGVTSSYVDQPDNSAAVQNFIEQRVKRERSIPVPREESLEEASPEEKYLEESYLEDEEGVPEEVLGAEEQEATPGAEEQEEPEVEEELRPSSEDAGGQEEEEFQPEEDDQPVADEQQETEPVTEVGEKVGGEADEQQQPVGRASRLTTSPQTSASAPQPTPPAPQQQSGRDVRTFDNDAVVAEEFSKEGRAPRTFSDEMDFSAPLEKPGRGDRALEPMPDVGDLQRPRRTFADRLRTVFGRGGRNRALERQEAPSSELADKVRGLIDSDKQPPPKERTQTQPRLFDREGNLEKNFVNDEDFTPAKAEPPQAEPPKSEEAPKAAPGKSGRRRKKPATPTAAPAGATAPQQQPPEANTPEAPSTKRDGKKPAAPMPAEQPPVVEAQQPTPKPEKPKSGRSKPASTATQQEQPEGNTPAPERAATTPTQEEPKVEPPTTNNKGGRRKPATSGTSARGRTSKPASGPKAGKPGKANQPTQPSPQEEKATTAPAAAPSKPESSGKSGSGTRRGSSKAKPPAEEAPKAEEVPKAEAPKNDETPSRERRLEQLEEAIQSIEYADNPWPHERDMLKKLKEEQATLLERSNETQEKPEPAEEAPSKPKASRGARRGKVPTEKPAATNETPKGEPKAKQEEPQAEPKKGSTTTTSDAEKKDGETTAPSPRRRRAQPTEAKSADVSKDEPPKSNTAQAKTETAKPPGNKKSKPKEAEVRDVTEADVRSDGEDEQEEPVDFGGGNSEAVLGKPRTQEEKEEAAAAAQKEKEEAARRREEKRNAGEEFAKSEAARRAEELRSKVQSAASKKGKSAAEVGGFSAGTDVKPVTKKREVSFSEKAREGLTPEDTERLTGLGGKVDYDESEELPNGIRLYKGDHAVTITNDGGRLTAIPAKKSGKSGQYKEKEVALSGKEITPKQISALLGGKEIEDGEVDEKVSPAEKKKRAADEKRRESLKDEYYGLVNAERRTSKDEKRMEKLEKEIEELERTMKFIGFPKNNFVDWL